MISMCLFIDLRIYTVQEVEWPLQGYTTNEQELEKIKPASYSLVKIRLHPTEEEKPKDIVVITNKRQEN